MLAFTIAAENLRQIAWVQFQLMGYEVQSAYNQSLKLLYVHYWDYKLSEIHSIIDEELQKRFNQAMVKYQSLETSDAPTREVKERLQKGLDELNLHIGLTFSNDEDYYMF